MGNYRVEADKATYSSWQGCSLKLYNDGCTGPDGQGALRDIIDSIGAAEHFVFISDWSFHPEFRIDPGGDAGTSIGRMLVNLALDNPKLVIAIHTWNHTVGGATDNQNDEGMILLLRFLDEEIVKRNEKRAASGSPKLTRAQSLNFVPTNLLWRMSSRDDTGFSHHEKVVVFDAPAPGGRRQVRAFYGGLDLTKGRFDWSEHRNLPGDGGTEWMSKQIAEGGQKYDEWYSAEFDSFSEGGDRLTLARQTWHDVHGRIEGSVAWDLMREFAGRWTPEGGSTVDPRPWDGSLPSLYIHQPVLDKFNDVWNSRAFVPRDERLRGPFEAQVVRSIKSVHWRAPARAIVGNQYAPATPVDTELRWRVTQSREYEASILEAYRNHIRNAQRFIYIENQYFIGSGARWTDTRDSVKNDIPEQLVKRIMAARKAAAKFHVYIVVPLFPEGGPADGSIAGVRCLQWRTIDYMVKALYGAMGEDWINYLSFYFLAQWSEPLGTKLKKNASRQERVRASQRYMIYGHSKVMICDDTSLMLGSCNLNERGLAGNRDTEICVSHWPMSGRERECMVVLKDLRRRIWTEHLAPSLDNSKMKSLDWEHPESDACTSQVRYLSRLNYANFRNNRDRSRSGHLCAWPIRYDPAANEITLAVPAQARGQSSQSAPALAELAPAQFAPDLEHELLPDHETITDLENADLAWRPTRDEKELKKLLTELRKNKWAVRCSKEFAVTFLTE